MSAAIAAFVVVLVGAALVRLASGLVDGAASVGRRRVHAPPSAAGALRDAAIVVDADDAWTAWLVSIGAVTLVGFAVGGIGLALVAGAAAAVVPVAVVATRRGRAARAVDDALPGVLDALARSLRTGATLHQAIAEAVSRARGRLALDLRRVHDETTGGAPLVEAVDAWAARCPTPGVRLAVAAIALSAESGGAAARAIDGVAATLRANLAVAGELRAQSSQARLSGLVIALAPIAFGALAAGTDPRTATFLLRTPIGLACLASGLVLDGVAAWWMQRITAAVA